MSSLSWTSGGITLTNQSMVLVSGAEELAQRLRARLNIHAGEWFLDQRVYCRYIQYMSQKPFPQNEFDAMLKSVIVATPGVDSLLSYDTSTNQADRRLTVNFTVLTSDGEELEAVGDATDYGYLNFMFYNNLGAIF